MPKEQPGVALEQGHAPQSPADGGCEDSHTAPTVAEGQGHAHPEDPAGGGAAQGAYGQMGTPQAGVPGPDMGQPHFSPQFPGASPYQGAPLSGQQMGAGAQAMPQGPVAGAPAGQASGTASGNPAYQPGFAPGYQPAYQPGFQPGYQPGYAQAPGGPVQMPGGPVPPPRATPGVSLGDENRYGELYGLIQEAANGNPDVSKFLNFFQSSGTDFWKGALVGAGLTFLVSSPMVKSALAGGLAGLWGKVSGGAQRTAEEMEAEEDRKAEERYAKEQHAKEATA